LQGSGRVRIRAFGLALDWGQHTDFSFPSRRYCHDIIHDQPQDASINSGYPYLIANPPPK
jgi:hypothetical protein